MEDWYFFELCNDVDEQEFNVVLSDSNSDLWIRFLLYLVAGVLQVSSALYRSKRGV